MGRLFGTDGVRGVANAAPLTPELACRLGRIAAAYLAERAGSTRRRPALLIGRDTRVSGPLLEQALVAGRALGGRGRAGRRRPPTPAVAALTPPSARRGGVGAVGLPQPVRGQRHQALLGRGRQAAGRLGGRDRGAARGGLGRAPADGRRHRAGSAPVPGAERRYLDGLRASLPPDFDLAGCRIVLDCAHGATYRVAPRLFRALGAEVATLGDAADRHEHQPRTWARSTRRRSRRACGRRPARSVSRSTGTATA